MENRDDRKIVASVLNGDTAQYRYLVERYQKDLVQHLYNLTYDGDMAEDIAQDAFIRAYEKLSQYNSDFAFSTWLYKIAHTIAYRKIQQRTPQVCLDDVQEILSDHAPTAAEQLDSAFTRRTIRAAIGELPLEYRQVVTLYYWSNCSYEEIAQILDHPIGTIRTWLYRAKEQLRKELHGRV